MAKRFKLRISRVIATTLQSCRSKDPSTLPEHPVPSFSTLNPNGQNQAHCNRPSFNPRVSSSLMPFGAACAPPSNKQNPDGTKSQEFKWKKEEKWHVVAQINYEKPTPRRKIYNSSEDDLSLLQPTPPAPPPSSDEKRKRRGKRNKKRSNIPSRLRVSTSSAESGWFSSEGGAGAGACDERDQEETETLVSSSLSLSTDSSSEFNAHSQLQPIGETHPFTANFPHRRNKRRVSKRPTRAVLRPPSTSAAATTAEAEIPARLSMFKKLMPCTVDGKVKESYAIVKRSEDPYEDFKNSMMDMILEKQMFEAKDLEQLLQCFLSLNSKHYHGIIVEAFSEIWEAIFSASGYDKPSSIQNHSRVSSS